MQKRAIWLRSAAAAAVMIAALLLILQCTGIYVRNGQFSRETVAAGLRTVAPALSVCMATIVAAFIFSEEQSIRRVRMAPENRLRLMKARVGELPEDAIWEEKLRKRIRIGSGTAAGLCIAASLSWLLNRNHFVSWDLEVVLRQMLLHVGPWMAAAFAVMIAASCACGRSAEREAEILKAAPMVEAATRREARRIPTAGIRMVLYAVAAAFIVLGAMNGGAYDVLVKAVNICTECIGLG